MDIISREITFSGNSLWVVVVCVVVITLVSYLLTREKKEAFLAFLVCSLVFGWFYYDQKDLRIEEIKAEVTDWNEVFELNGYEYKSRDGNVVILEKRWIVDE